MQKLRYLKKWLRVLICNRSPKILTFLASKKRSTGCRKVMVTLALNTGVAAVAETMEVFQAVSQDSTVSVQEE